MKRNASSTHNAYITELAQIKIVKIEKNNRPVTIMAMLLITTPAWQKSTCRLKNQETQASNFITADHPIANVTNLVMDKLPPSTISAFQEAKLFGAIEK